MIGYRHWELSDRVWGLWDWTSHFSLIGLGNREVGRWGFVYWGIGVFVYRDIGRSGIGGSVIKALGVSADRGLGCQGFGIVIRVLGDRGSAIGRLGDRGWRIGNGGIGDWRIG